MRTVDELKRLLGRNEHKRAAYYAKLMRAANALQRLDKERKRLVKSMKEARKRERDMAKRYDPLPSQVQ
jgi:hypothetical protein